MASTPFFGIQTSPVPILYIMADRTPEELVATCARVGVPLEKLGVRIVTLSDYSSFPLLTEILDKHARKDYLVFVEPLPFFVVDSINRPCNINDNTQVARFLASLKVKCYKEKYTLFGSCHAPKAKEGAGYQTIREKIAGTSAWGAYSATNICMEFQDPTDTSSAYRTIHFILRESRSFSKQLQFTEAGRLEVCQPNKSNAWASLDKELGNWPVGQSFGTQELDMWMGLVNCSRKTVYRWIEEKLSTAEVDRVDRGQYKRRLVPVQ